MTHIFARTLSEPHAYFHREFRNLDPTNLANSLGVWTLVAGRLALDIEGDHLIPVVWQGRLFLFWAIFSQEADEPQRPTSQQGRAAPTPPTKFWRLKLAWSEYKSGAWTSRRLAQDDLSYTCALTAVEADLRIDGDRGRRHATGSTSTSPYRKTASRSRAFYHNDYYDELSSPSRRCSSTARGSSGRGGAVLPSATRHTAAIGFAQILRRRLAEAPVDGTRAR